LGCRAISRKAIPDTAPCCGRRENTKIVPFYFAFARHGFQNAGPDRASIGDAVADRVHHFILRKPKELEIGQIGEWVQLMVRQSLPGHLKSAKGAPRHRNQ
jgi:hypothetical protein